MVGIILIISAAFAATDFETVPACSTINDVDSSNELIVFTCPGKLFTFNKETGKLNSDELGTVQNNLECESNIKNEICWNEEKIFKTPTGYYSYIL